MLQWIQAVKEKQVSEEVHLTGFFISLTSEEGYMNNVYFKYCGWVGLAHFTLAKEIKAKCLNPT